jgi:hypothetical protein
MWGKVSLGNMGTQEQGSGREELGYERKEKEGHEGGSPRMRRKREK